MGIILNVCEKCGRSFRETAFYTDCTKSPKYVNHLPRGHQKFDIKAISKPDKKSGKRKHRKDNR